MELLKGTACFIIILASFASVFAAEYGYGVHAHDCHLHEHSCKTWEKFDKATCSCIPANLPRPPRPSRPVCFRVLDCPNLQTFDLNSCRCECPRDADLNCGRGQFLDRSSCRCACRNNGNTCNQLQDFDRNTCECVCRAVIPAFFDDDDDTTTGTRTTRTTRTTRRSTRRTSRSRRSAPDFPLQERVKRSRSRRRSRSRSRSSSSSSSSSTTDTSRSPFTLLSRCPGGQQLDTATCQCFF